MESLDLASEITTDKLYYWNDTTTCAAAEPCEVLSWDVDALVEFLRKKRDVRLCVNALIATAKLESYMHLDPTNERAKW